MQEKYFSKKPNKSRKNLHKIELIFIIIYKKQSLIKMALKLQLKKEVVYSNLPHLPIAAKTSSVFYHKQKFSLQNQLIVRKKNIPGQRKIGCF